MMSQLSPEHFLVQNFQGVKKIYSEEWRGES